MRKIDPNVLNVPVYGSKVNLDSELSLKASDLAASMRYRARNMVLSSKMLNRIYFRMRKKERKTNEFRAAAGETLSALNGLECLEECIGTSFISYAYNSLPQSG